MIVLSIAGSDSSGGAGIQADIKTISALGGYAASVITAVTAQNTLGVQAVFPLPADVVRAQIVSVMDDLQPDAVKIGMLHDAAIAHVVAECMRCYRPRFIVYDPVMISTSGHRLLADDAIRVIKEELLPLCTLITPNLSEASLLVGYPVSTVGEMTQAAQELSLCYGTSVLVKGGHLDGNSMCDVLCDVQSVNSSVEASRHAACTCYEASRIESHNLHGTGCTLSSAIATGLASGSTLAEAVRSAKAYVGTAIAKGVGLQIGHGNGPLWHF